MKKITQNLMVALTILSSMAIISQTEVEDSTLQELEEVVLMGSGVIDLAADRVTPVAASTIKGSEIQKKIGTQDITMTLVNTPSVLSLIHISEPTRLLSISYAVFCLKKKKKTRESLLKILIYVVQF